MTQRAVLPAFATALVGREHELEALRKLLVRPEVPLVTLTGAGGIGKTRLAARLAAEMTGHFADGVYFVPLAAVREAAAVVAAIVGVLGLEGDSGRAMIADFLRTRQVLLVLDNFEHLLLASSLVTELLVQAPDLTILTTSRAPLRISGEHEYPVGGLELPQSHDPLETLRERASVKLFVQRAQAVQPDFQLTAENAVTISGIVSRLGGLPLALELAAARLRLFDPEALLEHLEHPLSVLSGGARDLPSRQQTIRATLDWSHTLLEPPHQRLLARLGVFVGGFDLPSAEAVVDDAEVLDGLAVLVENSLVVRSGECFDMLEPVREYAVEKLLQRGELEMLRQRHARFCAEQATHALDANMRRIEQNLFGSEDYARSERGRLMTNLETALDWAMTHPEGATMVASLAIRARHLHYAEGQFELGRRLLERALERQDLPPLDRGRLLANLSQQHWALGNLEVSQQVLAEAMDLAQELKDPVGIASVLFYRGRNLTELGRAEEARRAFEEGIRLWQDLGSKRGEGILLVQLGRLELTTRDDAQAAAHFRQALAYFVQFQDAFSVAVAQLHLAMHAIIQGDFAEALRLVEPAIEHLEAERIYSDLATARMVRACALMGLSQTEQAISDFQAAHAIVSANRDVRGMSVLLQRLAGVAAITGREALSARLYAALASYGRVRGLEVNNPLDTHWPTPGDVQARLGTATFQSEWARGEPLSPHEALEDWIRAVASESASNTDQARNRLSDLTPREHEVLRLLVEGLSNPQIARSLGISTYTVNAHVRTLLSKLEVPNRAAAVRVALEQKLV